MSDGPDKSFERSAAEPPPGLAREILDMLRHNKKWWMIPIIIVLLLLSALLILGPSGMAPFLYPLF